MDADWIEQNRHAHTQLTALCSRLTPTHYERADDGWTVSAILAHLAFWDRRGAIILKAWDDGHLPRRPDDGFYDSHVLNDANLPDWLVVPGPDAARLALAAATAVDQVVAALKPGTVDAIAAMDELWRVRRHNHRMDHVDQVIRLTGV
jgi:hypothetical protein